EEAQRSDHAAEGGPDDLAGEHGPRRREGEVPCLEVLHQDAGHGDDRLDQAAAGEGGDDAVLPAGEGGEDEEGDLAVVVGHVDVGEAGAVGVAEGQGRGEDVADDDVVPLELWEHDWDHDDGDRGEDCVAGYGEP
ncbi:hypothetical protein TorRG33x02_114080, partial [Trema orientale]